MRLITQAIYDETKFLLRKYPQLKQEEIGKLVNAPWGGISYRTVWLIKESNSLEEYRQMQKKHHLEEEQRKKQKDAVPASDEKPPVAEKTDKAPEGINLRRIAELLWCIWCIAYELDKETLPLSVSKNKEGNTHG